MYFYNTSQGTKSVYGDALYFGKMTVNGIIQQLYKIQQILTWYVDGRKQYQWTNALQEVPLKDMVCTIVVIGIRVILISKFQM